MKIWFVGGAMAVAVLFNYEAVAADATTLDLRDALVLVAEKNPKLRAAPYSERAARARIQDAELGRPLRLGVILENLLASKSGGEAVEATLSLAYVLELGDKSARRGDVARAGHKMLLDEQYSERMAVLAETTKRFIHQVTDQERLSIARDGLALARRLEKVVSRRVALGKASKAERYRAAITLARAELELEHAEHELLASRMRLVSMWGERAPGEFHARANLFDTAEPKSFEQQAETLRRNPDLRRLLSQRELTKTRTRLARAARNPDVEVSAGVRRIEASDDTALMFSASIPLGSAKRAAPSISEALALESTEPLAYEARYHELYARLFELHQELRHAHTAVRTLRERIIPDARQALTEYEKAYSSGRFSFLELSDSRRLVLESRREAIQAAEDYHRTRIEIERLLGVPLLEENRS